MKPVRCPSLALKHVLREYSVGAVTVRIGYDEEYELVYCIDEPVAEEEVVNAAMRLSEAVMVEGYDAIPPPSELRGICKRYGVDYDLVRSRYDVVAYYVAKAVSGYGPLYPLLRDQLIEEIAVDGPNRPVAVLTRVVPGSWARTNIVLDEETLNTLVINLAYRAGKSVSVAHPYVEGILPEGHRIALTYLSEVSRFGSSVVIRKHLSTPLTPVDLLRSGMIGVVELAYLWLAIEYAGSLLIVGPAASGKTTLLQALLMLVPPDKRVVTIEDAPELNLSWHRYWDSLVTRHSYGGDAEDVDLYKLAKFALRRRADYMVIGEVRGEEARILVHAASSGHGALATFHAEDAEAALTRLRAPPISIGESFLQSLWGIVSLSRLSVGGRETRKVIAIDEVVPSGDGIALKPVYRLGDELTPEEVASRSYRLAKIASLLGWDRERLVDELGSRVEFLSSLASNGVSDYMEFVQRVREFYRVRRHGAHTV